MGIGLCFDHFLCLIFWADFWLEKGEFGLEFFKEIVALSNKLMLGF